MDKEWLEKLIDATKNLTSVEEAKEYSRQYEHDFKKQIGKAG